MRAASAYADDDMTMLETFMITVLVVVYVSTPILSNGGTERALRNILLF